MKHINIFLTLIITCFMASCTDEESPQTIPYAPCNFTINLDSWDSHLNGGYNVAIYIPKGIQTDYNKEISNLAFVKTYATPRSGETNARYGYGGVLVINRTNDGFEAYDLSCPNENLSNIRVIPNNNYEAKCPKCGSMFSIIDKNDGRPISGPANQRLQIYRVISDGGNKYRVMN